MEKGGACPSRGFPFREQPDFEVLMVGDRKAFQEFPTKLSGQIEQTIRGKGIGACGEFPSNFEQIDGGSSGSKSTYSRSATIRSLAGLIHERTQPAQRPPKRSARIIRHVPEQVAKPLATMAAAGKNQVCQQRACLAGFGKVLRRSSL